jgi:hypothetical protein
MFPSSVVPSFAHLIPASSVLAAIPWQFEACVIQLADPGASEDQLIG